MGNNPVPPYLIPHIDRTSFVADDQHCLRGRGAYKVKLLVLHNTETNGEGNAPSGEWLSTDPESGASIHHLYGRDGTRYDVVPRVDTAYHCGVSRWKQWGGNIGGVGVCNLISIGHEFESNSTLARPGEGYSDAQLRSAGYTLATELVTYGLEWERDVATHQQIALPWYGSNSPENRRNDPSHFPMDTLRGYMQEWLTFLRTINPALLPNWCI